MKVGGLFVSRTDTWSYNSKHLLFNKNSYLKPYNFSQIFAIRQEY